MRFQKAARPPKLRGAPALPRGPHLYHTNKGGIKLVGPGRPPSGFVTRQTTGSEWVWYWASMRVLDPLRDPRQGPFYGGQYWQYQQQALGELGSHAKAKSTNIDFVYTLGYPPIACRIQTFRYHLATTSMAQERDTKKATELMGGGYELVDVYESEFLSDITGATAIVAVKAMLGLVRYQNPLTAGTTYATRNPLQ